MARNRTNPIRPQNSPADLTIRGRHELGKSSGSTVTDLMDEDARGRQTARSTPAFAALADLGSIRTFGNTVGRARHYGANYAAPFPIFDLALGSYRRPLEYSSCP